MGNRLLSVNAGSFGQGLFQYAEGKCPVSDFMLCNASPICLRLFWHFARAADSRTFWTTGNNRPIRMAMIATTTSNSIKVKAERARYFIENSQFNAGVGNEKQLTVQKSTAVSDGEPRPPGQQSVPCQ